LRKLSTGREYDADTDFYYYRSRYLRAGTGRFNRLDDVKDSYNMYAYTGWNPVSYADPWGEKKGKNTKRVAAFIVTAGGSEIARGLAGSDNRTVQAFGVQMKNVTDAIFTITTAAGAGAIEMAILSGGDPFAMLFGALSGATTGIALALVRETSPKSEIEVAYERFPWVHLAGTGATVLTGLPVNAPYAPYHPIISFMQNERRIFLEAHPFSEVGSKDDVEHKKLRETQGLIALGNLTRVNYPGESKHYSKVTTAFKDKIPVPEGMTVERFKQKLIEAHNAYHNMTPYCLVPTENSHCRNSASYVWYLLKYAGSTYTPRRLCTGWNFNDMPTSMETGAGENKQVGINVGGARIVYGEKLCD